MDDLAANLTADKNRHDGDHPKSQSQHHATIIPPPPPGAASDSRADVTTRPPESDLWGPLVVDDSQREDPMDDPATHLTVESKREAPELRSCVAEPPVRMTLPPKRTEMAKPPAKPLALNDVDGLTLLVGPQSRHWRRTLGPLAWAALEHLALAAQPLELGWVAPVGVRDVAAGIGVTKDTAARAVKVLRAADLVALEELDCLHGQRRTGYRLHLPQGLELRACPPDQCGAQRPASTKRCPTSADTGIGPPERGSPPSADVAESTLKRRRPRQPGSRRLAATAAQATLFDPAKADRVEGTSGMGPVNPRAEAAIDYSHSPEEVVQGA